VDAAGPAPPERPSDHGLLLRAVLIVIGRFVALEVIGLFSLAQLVRRPLAHGLRMWTEWDAGHYLRIAKVGYRAHGLGNDDPLFIVFFPGYPAVVRLVSFAVRNLIVSGLLVSALASVGAGWMLYKLARLDGDHDEAWRAVVLLFSFPTAFFLAAPYSESMFLFVVLAAMYAARTNRWGRSAVAGAVATATRVAGVALLPALAFAALTSPGSWSARTRRLVLVGLSVTGLAAYLVINQIVHDDAFWFLHVQRSHWYQRPVPPWEPVIDAVGELIEGQRDSAYALIFASRLAAIAFAIPMLVLATRWLRRADAIYGWAALLVVGSTSWLISLPRYLLPIYPIFVVEAKLTRSRRVFWPIVVAGSVAQAWLFWRYVRADWAF
jgi:hypothetical protein